MSKKIALVLTILSTFVLASCSNNDVKSKSATQNSSTVSSSKASHSSHSTTTQRKSYPKASSQSKVLKANYQNFLSNLKDVSADSYYKVAQASYDPDSRTLHLLMAAGPEYEHGDELKDSIDQALKAGNEFIKEYSPMPQDTKPILVQAEDTNGKPYGHSSNLGSFEYDVDVNNSENENE
ncbi:hypothetical protein LROSL1_1312 [Furfurilactobacillus rossiae]|uniref:hypothetical protein n=1 Tax=Furfurilactobacillus rossiae TaxID=231049 RepID=UPI0015B99FE3|nr:hypothetical protein [Furfurilactobacillus rossiae]MCF6166906.1 hypothetical protein [Furfurilactobacillus rossiae]QLE64129.1 hypothetical protein LROSL1_1312 [Furfurilactobacillus rossiae]